MRYRKPLCFPIPYPQDFSAIKSLFRKIRKNKEGHKNNQPCEDNAVKKCGQAGISLPPGTGTVDGRWKTRTFCSFPVSVSWVVSTT
jgi:hypothetical protein